MIGPLGRQVRNGQSSRASANRKNAWPGQLLSDRELEVARRLCKMDEPTVAVAARDLGITEQGCNDHLTRIYRKLGVRTRLGMYRVLAEEYDIRMDK